MEITPVAPAGRQLIQAYGDGGFRIAGVDHLGSVVVSPGRTVPWPAKAPEEIDGAGLLHILQAGEGLDILLLGTGRCLVRPSADLMAELKSRLGCGLEVMDSAAAARTFNVLLGENRPVAAALIAV